MMNTLGSKNQGQGMPNDELCLTSCSSSVTLAGELPEPKSQIDLEAAVVEAILPRQDGGKDAWLFLICATLGEFIIWGQSFSYGNWESFYVSVAFPTSSPSEIAVVGTTTLGLNYSLVLPGIIFCRKYPHFVKVGMRICLFSYVASLLIASFATSVTFLIVFQGVIPGIAGAFMWSPIYVYLEEWFVERRSLAGSVIFAGAGGAGFLFPLIISKLCDVVGFRWALRFFSLLTLVLGGISVWGLRPRIPLSIKSVEPAVMDWSFMKDHIFWIIASVIIVQGGAYNSVTIYLSTYASTFTTQFTAGLSLAILNIASMVGQIFMGYMCDRMEYTKVIGSTTLSFCISVLGLLRIADSVGKIFGAAILIGIFAGGFSSSWFPATTDIVKLGGGHARSTGEIFGILSAIRGIASIGIPIAAGLLYDKTSSVDTVWGNHGLGGLVQFVGFMALGAVGLIALLQVMRIRRMKQMRQAGGIEVQRTRTMVGSQDLEKDCVKG